jgi:hypothetical protein
MCPRRKTMPKNQSQDTYQQANEVQLEIMSTLPNHKFPIKLNKSHFLFTFHKNNPTTQP